MRFTRRLLLGATLLLPFAFAQVAGAAEPYLTAKQLDLGQILPPPPAPGSAQDQADVAAVVAAQAAASKERIALADADADETVFVMYTATLGAAFVPANLPVASVFFERVGQSEDDTVDPWKKHFARQRPWIAHADTVKALIRSSKSGSYPSGHTTRVTMAAILLSGMLPEKRTEIWARAAEYAQSRVVGGMHYPTDLEAGVRAGTAMAVTMMTDPAFRADYAAATAELRKALGL